ncbi:MAG: hypothetical protein U9R31_03660 [Candidatus Omnitrophota bacterium]|nr:hypothetical protein [Candidatus Omnitrophota bacterium]
MLIVFAGIAVVGVTTFIIQRLSQNEVDRIRTKCIYTARGGINEAIYSYRFHDLTGNGYFSLGRFNIGTDNFFVLGGTQADLLMVNTSESFRFKDEQFGLLKGLTVQNATSSKAITIDRLIVTWDTGVMLLEIWINGSKVWGEGEEGKRSPADCDIDDFILDTTPVVIDPLVFHGSISGTTINIEFVMKNGSTKGLTVFPKSQNYSFTVKSTGKTTNSNIYRTIRADYNALTSKITNYSEIDTEITP